MALQLFTNPEEDKVQLCAMGSKYVFIRIKLKEFPNIRVSTAEANKRNVSPNQNLRSSMNIFPKLNSNCKTQISMEKTPGKYLNKIPNYVSTNNNISKYTSQKMLNQSNAYKSSEMRNSTTKINQKVIYPEKIINIYQITLNKQNILKSYLQKFHSIIRERGKELLKIQYIINEKYNHIQKSRMRTREIIDSECARIYREDIEIKNFKDFIYDETIHKKLNEIDTL